MPASLIRRRALRGPVAAVLTLGLVLSTAVTATAEPAAADAIEIGSDDLRVEVSPDFPQVLTYTHTAGGTLAGDDQPLTSMVINGEKREIEVTSINSDEDTARYAIDVPALAGISLSAELSVKDNVVSFAITKITEDDDVKIRTISIPGQDLVTISSDDASPVLASSRTSVDRGKSGDTITPVTKDTPVGEVGRSAYVLANTAELAAGFESNSLADSDTPEGKTDNARFQHVATRDDNGAVRIGISSGPWLYRAKGSDQKEELPWFKVVITPDANDDSTVTWQDAAIAMREIAVMPNRGEDVKDQVVQRIPFNFASQATHPFLRTLDDTKRIALATDGLGQSAVLKGFGSEGHDSANTDFADNYNTRAGGLDDLNHLLQESEDWNTSYGIHINQTEAYPESRFFDEELIKPDQKGWNWLDQSFYIRQDRHILSGNLASRVKKFREQTNDNLDMVYVDVYYNNGWLAERLQQELVKNGFRVGSEWSDKLPRNNTWAHWAVDENYGGASNKGINSQIQRFIFNDVRDTWNPHPLLGNTTLSEFEGWTGHTDYDAFLKNTWEHNLPTKFIQQHKITSWGDERIELTDAVAVHGTSADNRVIEVEGEAVARGGTYLLPWDSLKNRGREQTKLYHYNPEGGSTTWTLTGELATERYLDVHALSDDGRTKITRLTVEDGTVTIDAEAGQPYVLTPRGSRPELPDPEFGSHSQVKDPGFNQKDFTDSWDAQGQTSIVKIDKGHRVAELGAGEASISQRLGALDPGTYSVSAWVEIEPGKQRPTTLTVDGDGVKPATVTLDRSTAENFVAADEKHSTHFQRLRALVDVTEKGATPTLTFSADDGSAPVRIDDVRVVETTRPAASDAVYAEDFEDVDQGWGPFIKGPAGGANDPRTHLSERNEPYTQSGWNGNLVDDVLDGTWSLKSNGENRNPGEDSGLVYRTSESTIPLESGHRYRVSFDYQNSRAGEYAWAHGYDTDAGPVVSGQQELGEQRTTDRVQYEFTAGQCGANWTGLARTGSDGAALFSLDNLEVHDLGPVDEQPACATVGFDQNEPSLYPGKENTVTTRLTSNEPVTAEQIRVQLSVPEGWTATPTSPAEADELAPGKTLETTWSVVPPEDASGAGKITATADYTVDGEPRTADATTEANVITAFPSGDTWASDHTWVSADNGWGPVERDQSNGGQGQGDGTPLTLQGKVYGKGLGAHAPSTIRYYTGGRCTSFTADVGVDDAQPTRGTITFSVLADEKEVAASSGVMKPDSHTETLTADITGAEFVDLEVTEGGDGNGNDHADWGGAKFTCD